MRRLRFLVCRRNGEVLFRWLAGIKDCYTSVIGQTATLGNFAKVRRRYRDGGKCSNLIVYCMLIVYYSYRTQLLFVSHNELLNVRDLGHERRHPENDSYSRPLEGAAPRQVPLPETLPVPGPLRPSPAGGALPALHLV